MENEIKIIVKYADTDRMNRVYYARYLEYFELGRTNYLKDKFISYKKIEDDYNIFMPVIEVTVKYFAPIEYEECLKLITRIDLINDKKFRFIYSLFAKEKLVAKGETKHVFVDKDNKVITWNDFLSIIEKK